MVAASNYTLTIATWWGRQANLKT